MKTFFIASGIVGVLGLTALLADIKTDYDHAADFKNFRTYSWIKVDAGDSLWSDRIRQAVDRQMSAKGLTRRESGGDLAVAAIGRTREEQTYTTFYDGLGGGWFWRGFGGQGMATTSVQETPVGTLTVDMFNGATRKLVWRGTSSKTLSKDAEKNTKKLDDAVADMFKRFPPKGES
jgi:hypothetical protein